MTKERGWGSSKLDSNKGQDMMFRVGYSQINQRATNVIWVNSRRCLLFKLPGPAERNLENLLENPKYLKFAKKVNLPDYSA
jgi:hypothetical protein